MQVQVHPLADLEFDAALTHYHAIDWNVGLRFADNFYQSAQDIGSDPERWRLRDGWYRRVNLDRFPYYLPYIIHQGQVWILAVAHERRKPFYWENRVPE